MSTEQPTVGIWRPAPSWQAVLFGNGGCQVDVRVIFLTGAVSNLRPPPPNAQSRCHRDSASHNQRVTHQRSSFKTKKKNGLDGALTSVLVTVPTQLAGPVMSSAGSWLAAAEKVQRRCQVKGAPWGHIPVRPGGARGQPGHPS